VLAAVTVAVILAPVVFVSVVFVSIVGLIVRSWSVAIRMAFCYKNRFAGD
jgi:hypothetical protein